MTFHLEKNGECYRKITCTVDAAVAEQEYQKALSEIVKTEQIPGFRPGKAPLRRIKELCEHKIETRWRELLVNERFKEAMKLVEGRCVDPKRMPALDFGELVLGKDFTFTLEVEVIPDLGPLVWQNLEIDIPAADDSEAIERQAQEALKALQDRDSTIVPVTDRSHTQRTDFLLADVFVTVLGQSEEELLISEALIDLDSEAEWGYIAQHLINQQVPGEIVCENFYPEKGQIPRFRGQNLRYRFVTKLLKRAQPPEFNQDYANDLGFASTDELWASLLKEAEYRSERGYKHLQREKVLEALRKANPVEAPKTMVAEETKYLVQQSMYFYSQKPGNENHQFTQEEYNTLFAENYEYAEIAVQNHLLLDVIKKQLSLDVTEDDVKALLQEWQKWLADDQGQKMLSQEFAGVNNLVEVVPTEVILNKICAQVIQHAKPVAKEL